MAEIEEVIAGLEYCIGRNGCWSDDNHEECPWISKCREDSSSLKRAALELLKRQQGKWIECTVRGSNSLRCSVCGADSGTICETDYCPNCGARMR